MDTEEINVLHVDDEPALAELAADMLHREDDRFSVETARSASEGSDRLAADNYDCIVSDYNMPGMDGIEFLQAVREEYPDIPFILFTGRGSEAVASEAIAADVTGYLQKGSGSEKYELLANRIRNAVQARREAQRADRQEQLMRLTEFAGDTGGFELDRKSDTIQLTAGVRRIIERPEQTEIPVEEAIELFHPDDREGIQQILDRAFETGEELHDRWRLQPGDGDERLLDITLTPVVESGGQVTKLRGAVNDITDRKERQRKLKQIETLFQHAQDSLFLIDVAEEFSIERVNPAWEDETGLSAERVRGQTPRAVLGEQPGANAETKYNECIQRQEPLQYEETLRFDGENSYWITQIAPVVIDGTVKYLVGSTRNVTEQKERQQDLEQARDLMSNMEELTDAGAWEYDSASEQLMITDGTRQLYGLNPDEDLTLEAALDAVHPDDRDRLADRLTNCLETGEPYEINVRLTTGDEAQRWLTAQGERVSESETGSVVRGYIRDITDEKTRERRLTELNQATQALLAAETRQEVADIGVEAASDILDFKANAIHVPEAGDTQLVPAAQTDEVASLIGDVQPLPVTDSIAGRVYRDGEPAVIADVQQDPDIHNSETNLGGHLYLPLADHGILIAGSENPAAFDQQDLALGELLAGTLVAAFNRVEREQNARQRQQELALFFEESPLGAIQWDDEFRFERLNARAEGILGYDEPELRGESWETIVAPDDHDKVNTVVKNLLDADGGTHVLNLNVRKDGEVITAEWHNRAITDEDGNVQSIFSKFQDVTERENRKRELEEYETIIEALTDAVYVLDEEGRFTYVNDELVELVGYDRETIIGSLPALIKDEEAVERAEHQLGQLLSSDGPETVTFEVTIHPQEGDPIDCEDHMGVLPYEGDQFNGSVGTLRDVTHRKKREQELQELKNQYETLAENFPDGAVFLINTDLEYVRAGGKELNNLGLSPNDIESAKPHDLFPEEVADELCHYYEEALDGNANTFEQEYGGKRYRIQTVPVRTDSEEIGRVMAVSQNVTEDVKEKQELERQNKRLEEFTSIVSHDLRNPLQVADGRLELIREECESEHIDDVAQALGRMDTLIEDLLTLAREGKQVDETESVGLADVATNSWQTTNAEQAALETHTSRAIKADQSRLRQLFENLYRNAVEHGSNDVTVTVGAMDDGFYVADTGPGIPESEREEVFEAGYSTNEDGTGFGLRIVEQIASAHGWEIAVGESEQGGARFEVTGVEFADH
ncbi:PAS domain S-box protein [Salinibaculum salinum]|uniref:PAS domain S-box protein n=1 Tax=Salinibaculum salinum TaxID=3131996 RepID=UPI0030EC47BD